MSALYDAEEADQEAAERLRVAEWAAEHQNPLTAALQRAETAEKQRDAAMSVLTTLVGLADGRTEVRFRDVITASKALLKRTHTAEQTVLTLLARDGGDR